MRKISVSVRNLVELALRSGDIDNKYMSISRANEGTKVHTMIQKTYGLKDRKEVSLKHNLEYEGYQIEVQGRADGILVGDGDKHFIIDEIKSTTIDLELLDGSNQLHQAQAKCYGYFYMLDNGLESIDIQLTYYNINDEKMVKFISSYSFEELKDFFLGVVDRYIEISNLTFSWTESRDRSIESLDFPFTDYRQGQRELSVAVYGTIKEDKKIFIEAPTGIGKTMSTLYPSIKTIYHEKIDKVFYLTAKTITREAPIKAIEILRKNGLKIKTIVITAKEKICLNDEVKCNPEDCPYAKGHFDRVNDGMKDIFDKEDFFTRDKVIEYSKKHMVCPFEFSLDLSFWCDVIVCDYNYIFHPQVYLKRFFTVDENKYAFLIDEAHNLIDRARDMYSIGISKDEILGLRDLIDEKYKKIIKALGDIENKIDEFILLKGIKDRYYQREEFTELYYPLKKLISNLDVWLMEEKEDENYEEVLDIYFKTLNYTKISELYDENYVTYVEEDEDVVIKLLCIDPSNRIGDRTDKSHGCVFFSATMTPIDYYRHLLGGGEEDYYIKLSSPFPRENFSLNIANNISTKYKDREKTYEKIVDYLLEFINNKIGNYFLFFPSYSYMEKIADLLFERDINLKLLVQSRDMTEVEREEFLNRFSNEDGIIGFGVLGGIFSEGIDLEGDNLIGVGVVGVGLPGISYERDIIKDFFDEKFGNGFDYAYTYPGINKIFQGVGRLIRSEDDLGGVILIDSRYGEKRYISMFPNHWYGYNIIRRKEDINKYLSNFYS